MTNKNTITTTKDHLALDVVSMAAAAAASFDKLRRDSLSSSGGGGGGGNCKHENYDYDSFLSA